MKWFSYAAPFLALLLGAGCLAWSQESWSDDRPGEFDFYVLALSWSPSYCQAEGRNADPQQCRAARPFGFIVHGLWPQFERGAPERCGGGSGEVPRDLARSLGDLIPSPGLVRHEWRRHGTCSGLSQPDYFALLRKAHERTAIPTPFRNLQSARSLDPRQVEQAFVRANPGLKPDALAITCDGSLLREVRVCMNTDLSFRACPEVDRRACRRRVVQMPPMSGS